MKCILPLLVAGLLGCAVCSAAPVRIGAVYADSGPLKPLDEPSWRGAQAAAAVASRQGQPVELVRIAYDSTPSGAAAAVRAALARDPSIVAFVGVSDSNVALAAGREAMRAGRVFVTSGATSPLLPSQLGRRFFLACFGDNVQAAAAAEWLHRTRGARRVCVMHDTATIYTRLLRRFFEAAFTAAGGVVTESVAYRSGEPVPLPAKLREADAIFLSAGTAASAAVVIRQLRTAGFRGPIVGGDGYDNPSYWSGHADAARDVYFTTHAFPAREPGAASGATVERFRAAYRGTPDAFGGLGFDAVRLVLSGLSAGTDRLAASLQNGAPFPGVTGRIAFPRGQRVPTKPVAIVAAANPSRPLTQVTPSHVPSPSR
jgi:branched-chain amino acid transport system substrate-binding protein